MNIKVLFKIEYRAYFAVRFHEQIQTLHFLDRTVVLIISQLRCLTNLLQGHCLIGQLLRSSYLQMICFVLLIDQMI